MPPWCNIWSPGSPRNLWTLWMSICSWAWAVLWQAEDICYWSSPRELLPSTFQELWVLGLIFETQYCCVVQVNKCPSWCHCWTLWRSVWMFQKKSVRKWKEILEQLWSKWPRPGVIHHQRSLVWSDSGLETWLSSLALRQYNHCWKLVKIK